MNILACFKSIKAFVLDVDGVLTDGSLLLLEDGQMARRMSIKDGYALQLAIKRGYHVLVISGGSSNSVKLRLERLGINEVFMQVEDKKSLLIQFMAKHSLVSSELLYMGDDMPDLLAMQLAGVACCPADAVAEIKAIAHYISPLNGGFGCVRDVIEKVLKLNGHCMLDNSVVSK